MRLFSRFGFRLGCLALCLAAVLAIANPYAAGAELQPDTATESYASLVHSRASNQSAVIGQIEDGTELTVLAKTAKHYKIDCYEMNGYIDASQVNVVNGRYFVRCDVQSSQTAAVSQQPIADALLLRTSLLKLATEQLGTRYAYGRSAPGGFDCSGFTTYVFKSHGITLNRCADDQMQDGLIVSKEGLQVGDLVFFRSSYSPYLATHVGIYAGDGKMIHADSKGVCYDDLYSGYYADTYVGARRIVCASTAEPQLQSAAEVGNAAARMGSGLRKIR